ncbi:hypothetical protein LCGC14_0787790 [marine sediment metagenome]|uniref:Uncharacterized protein n=1 Tax=marine sediment metagenome TaxID=412755 RepID=A0A0F9PTP9_9ZZZZ
MRRMIKLWWKRWRLKRAYFALVRMENDLEQVACGQHVLGYIFPELRQQKEKMDTLLQECYALEGGVKNYGKQD